MTHWALSLGLSFGPQLGVSALGLSFGSAWVSALGLGFGSQVHGPCFWVSGSRAVLLVSGSRAVHLVSGSRAVHLVSGSRAVLSCLLFGSIGERSKL